MTSRPLPDGASEAYTGIAEPLAVDEACMSQVRDSAASDAVSSFDEGQRFSHRCSSTRGSESDASRGRCAGTGSALPVLAIDTYAARGVLEGL